jgi:hypothetical protein
MGIEFQRSKRLAPELNVRMRKQKVGAEAKEAAHRIWLVVQDRLVEFTTGDKVPTRGSEWALGQPQCRRQPPRICQILSGDGVDQDRWEYHVAASHVEARRTKLLGKDEARRIAANVSKLPPCPYAVPLTRSVVVALP